MNIQYILIQLVFHKQKLILNLFSYAYL